LRKNFPALWWSGNSVCVAPQPEGQRRIAGQTAAVLDRSISDIERTATEAWLLSRPRLEHKRVRREVPVFHGGETRIGAETMREIAWEDRTQV